MQLLLDFSPVYIPNDYLSISRYVYISNGIYLIIFWCTIRQTSPGGRACLLKTHHRIQVPKFNKNVRVQENKHVYLFSICFENSLLFSDKFKLLRRWCICEVEVSQPICHIFNPVPFILSLEDSHIGSRHGIITP